MEKEEGMKEEMKKEGRKENNGTMWDKETEEWGKGIYW